MKKVISVLMSALVTMGVLAGCGSKATKGNGGTTELTFFMHLWNSTVYNDNWKVFKKAESLTGVTLKGVASETATDSQQVFNIMMASGQLPDIIDFTKSGIEKYATDGAFVPLDDLIKEHAPNLQKFLNENSDVKKSITAPDGHIYYIPQIMDSEIAKGWLIRKDWIDKLGLKIPTTVEEYYQVLKAFVEKDPNGNGEKDEVGFFTRDVNTATKELLPLFGVKTGWDVVDGKIVYGEYTQDYKIAMSNIAKWYKEGIIDKEIFTRGGNSREILLGDNRGGSTHDWFTSTASFNTKLKDKIPGFVFQSIAPPKDIKGKVWEASSRGRTTDVGWAISMDNKSPENTIKYFDFWFTDEGRRLMNYGVEGEEYDLVDGKPKFKDHILNGEKPALTLLNEVGAQMPIGFAQDFEYERQIMDPYALEGVDLYKNNHYLVQAFPALSFTTDERNVIDSKWSAISTYMSETTQNWVFGTENVDDGFDKYISTLKSLGMDDIVAIYQQAYSRYDK